MLVTVWCHVRRFFRRWSWAYLFVLGLLLYPVAQESIVRYQARRAAVADRVGAATIAAAKTVDWEQVYSKFGIAIAAFCLLNLLAWAALVVVPVLPDWAKGHYKRTKAGLPARPGFKGTFLALSDTARIVVYLLVWGYQLAAAGLSIYAACNIQ